MKTMIKIAALAVITALALTACAPDAELTARDWSEANSQRDAKLINQNWNGTAVLPSIATNGLGGGNTLKGSDTTGITDEDKEIQLVFPSEADFLKVANDKLEAELQKFLTFFTFTTPIATTQTEEQYKFSEKKADVNYTFVKRVNGGTLPTNSKGATTLTIRLNELPVAGTNASATGVSATGLVMKIDGAKYKVGGKALDLDNDGKAGEAIYDDGYKVIAVPNGPTSYTQPGGGSGDGVSVFSVTINGPANNTTQSFTPAAWGISDSKREIATLTATGGLSNDLIPANAANNPAAKARHKAVLEALKDKIEIQQFNVASGKWEKHAVTSSLVYDTATGVDDFPGSLVITGFTADDFGIYRIYVSNIKGVKTSGLADFYGVEKKIRFNGADHGTDKYASRNIAFYNSLQHTLVETGGSVSLPAVKYEIKDINNAGKKALVDLKFGDIVFTAPGAGTPTTVYVAEDIDLFKKTFKLAYAPLGTTPLTALTDAEIAFLKFNVESIEKIHTGTPSVFQHTRVRITIDEGVKVNSTLLNKMYVVTSPDFSYGNTHLYFGAFDDIDTVIDGTKGWKLHGAITQ